MKATYDNKLQDFITFSSSTLFDIASCKCVSYASCCCPKDKKVPFKEKSFLADLRNDRKMLVGTVDKLETSIIQKRLDRNERVAANIGKVTSAASSSPNSGQTINSMEHFETSESEEAISESEPSTPTSRSSMPSGKRNKLALPSLARVCDRYGLSVRSASAVASAFLQDVGIIDINNTTFVIDKNKIH